MPEISNEFLKEIEKDPKFLGRLRKREELSNFKESYNLDRATPLRCPVCSVYLQSPGSLWADKIDPTKFVCRKCKLEFTLICHTPKNSQLIDDLRKIVKGEGTLPEWIKTSVMENKLKP